LRRLLALLALLSASPCPAQLLLTTADRHQGVNLSGCVFVDRFAFLDTRGLSVRGELAVTSRISPFLELGVVRYEAAAGFGNLPEQDETSWLLGAGGTGFVLGEAQLGWPLSLSGYSRLQYGRLKNIDLFSLQLLALGTWDLTDRWPLLVSLGGGVAYRYTKSEVADAVKPTTNDTKGRFVLGLQWPFRPQMALIGELAYEEQASGGLGLRYRP
jgi:hypothetical protein